MYKPASKIRRRYELSRTTLVSWGESGRVRIRRLGDGGRSGKRIYHIGDVERELGPVTRSEEKKECFIYARVSSAKQSGDLKRQVTELQESYPNHKTLKEIGSGLNYKRKHFKALLGRVMLGNVQEIVVSYRDRLCRYGFELFESVCNFHGTKIVVHNRSETTGSQQELAEDLLAVCNFFVARNNGYRGGKNKRRKLNEGQKDQAGSVNGVETSTTTVDGDVQMDIQQVPRNVQERCMQDEHD